MDFFFPLLTEICDPNNCDPELICWEEEERRTSREAQLWRQDGMPSKPRRSNKKNKNAIFRNDSYTTKYATDDDTGRSTRSNLPWNYRDDDSEMSHFPSNHQHDLVESETGKTYPTTGTESHSDDSGDSVWSPSSRGTRDNKQWSPSSRGTWHTKQSSAVTSTEKHNFGQHRRSAFPEPSNYGTIEEPGICNDWSMDDSVGAVRTSRKDIQQQQEGANGDTNYTFDYIRKASKKFVNPMLDPPSDKSVATSRSIRAEDAGSVLLRKGIIRAKNNELARVILKRRQQDLLKLGPKP